MEKYLGYYIYKKGDTIRTKKTCNDFFLSEGSENQIVTIEQDATIFNYLFRRQATEENIKEKICNMFERDLAEATLVKIKKNHYVIDICETLLTGSVTR